MLHDTFQKRFTELAASFRAMTIKQGSMSEDYYVEGQWQQWATSAQNLIRAVYSEASPHNRNFEKELARANSYKRHLDALHGIFLSAKEDFEGGYVFDVDTRISGEIFGDFVAMAKRSLSDGYKDVAAVLACAALEDTLTNKSVV